MLGVTDAIEVIQKSTWLPICDLRCSVEGIFYLIYSLDYLRIGEILCTALGFDVEGPCMDQDHSSAFQTPYIIKKPHCCP